MDTEIIDITPKTERERIVGVIVDLRNDWAQNRPLDEEMQFATEVAVSVLNEVLERISKTP